MGFFLSVKPVLLSVSKQKQSIKFVAATKQPRSFPAASKSPANASDCRYVAFDGDAWKDKDAASVFTQTIHSFIQALFQANVC